MNYKILRNDSTMPSFNLYDDKGKFVGVYASQEEAIEVIRKIKPKDETILAERCILSDEQICVKVLKTEHADLVAERNELKKHVEKLNDCINCKFNEILK